MAAPNARNDSPDTTPSPQNRRDPHSNHLIVIRGCMFSGKTTALIRRLAAAQNAGRRVLALKHHHDDRYDATQLATHDQRRWDATAVQTPADIASIAQNFDVIGIDEAQFFGRDLVAVCQNLRKAGKEIIASGIDHDAWGRPFPPVPALAEIADEVILLHAPCTICGQPARFSQRLAPVTDERMVGGTDDYQPRCDKHFQPLAIPAPDYRSR